MTRPDLDALQALLDKATPGPWDDCGAWVTPSHRKFTESRDENAALIVAAVNALPALLAYVRELEQERDEALGHAEIWHALSEVRSRESGSGYTHGAVEGALDAARRAAALAMRERCAQACEERALIYDGLESGASTSYFSHKMRGARTAAEECAAAILALEP